MRLEDCWRVAMAAGLPPDADMDDTGMAQADNLAAQVEVETEADDEAADSEPLQRALGVGQDEGMGAE